MLDLLLLLLQLRLLRLGKLLWLLLMVPSAVHGCNCSQLNGLDIVCIGIVIVMVDGTW